MKKKKEEERQERLSQEAYELELAELEAEKMVGFVVFVGVVVVVVPFGCLISNSFFLFIKTRFRPQNLLPHTSEMTKNGRRKRNKNKSNNSNNNNSTITNKVQQVVSVLGGEGGGLRWERMSQSMCKQKN